MCVAFAQWAMAPNRQPKLLIGNSFPLSLIVRRVVIEPRSMEELRKRITEATIVSFWGHPSTLEVASEAAGHDLTPSSIRPALILDAAGLPSLAGESFSECWVVSPEFSAGFRPPPNQAVPPDKILQWRALRLTWPDASPTAIPDL